MSAWRKEVLGSILEHTIGGVWGDAPGVNEVDVRVLRVTELKKHGVLDPTTAAQRSVSKNQLAGRRLQAGDLLLEKSGGGPNTPVGRVGLVRALDGPSICSNFMQLMRPKPEVVLARYLHLYLNHLHDCGATIGMQTASTNIRNIKSSDYLRVEVSLPSMDEQARIVNQLEDALSRLDAAVQSLQLAQSKAKSWAVASVDRLFQGVSERAAVQSLLREPMRNGHSASASASGDVRTLTLTSVTKREFTDANTKLTSADRARVRDLWLRSGDLLVQRSNTAELVGTCALYTGPDDWAIFPDLLIRLRPDESKILPAFLAAGLGSDRVHRELRAKAKGLAGSMPKIDQGTIGAQLVPCPDLETQRQLLVQHDRVQGGVARLLADEDRLRRDQVALRRSLLAAAFSGRLTSDVAEAADV